MEHGIGTIHSPQQPSEVINGRLPWAPGRWCIGGRPSRRRRRSRAPMRGTRSVCSWIFQISLFDNPTDLDSSGSAPPPSTLDPATWCFLANPPPPDTAGAVFSPRGPKKGLQDGSTGLADPPPPINLPWRPMRGVGGSRGFGKAAQRAPGWLPPSCWAGSLTHNPGRGGMPWGTHIAGTVHRRFRGS